MTAQNETSPSYEKQQILPDDHLSRFTGTNNDLPLELVAFRDPKLLHGADRTLIHV